VTGLELQHLTNSGFRDLLAGLRAHQGGRRYDSHSPQVKPVSVPACPDGGVVRRESIRVVVDRKDQYFEAGGIVLDERAGQFAHHLCGPWPMLWVTAVKRAVLRFLAAGRRLTGS